MGQILVVEARAKVNLYLRVGKRRENGYHDIQTLFHSIALSDRLEIEGASELTVTCSAPETPGGPSNLCYLAARRFCDRFSLSPRVRIHIEKKIPSQAGLGGGSADAAATLVGLNKLWGVGASMDELEEIGASLGADVPFCVRGGAAYAEGTGEILRPLAPLPDSWLVVVKPSVAISTRAAYGSLDQGGYPAGPDPDLALKAVRGGKVEALPGVLYNDFQAVALAREEEIRRAFADLGSCTQGALLCGSGSALFGLAADRKQAAGAEMNLRAKGWWAAATHFASEGVVVRPTDPI